LTNAETHFLTLT